MNSIPEAVSQILRQDDVAWQALQSGILNLSAYAAQICAEVERRVWKPARPATIVVALSRLAEQVQSTSPLKPDLRIESLSVRSGLAVVSFDLTSQQMVNHLSASSLMPPDSESFHATTFGDREVTYVLPSAQAELLQLRLQQAPKSNLTQVSGVTLRLPQAVLRQPNVIYAVLSRLAGWEIDVIELISTHSELTILVRDEQVRVVLEAVEGVMGSKTSR